MWPNSRRRFHPKSKVPWQVVHHDLIKVPLGRDRPGIFWLRLYGNAEDHVAVVSEVPGNPASSMTNAMKVIADWITENFAIQPQRLVIYEIWPRGSIGWERRNVRLVDFSGRWPQSSKRDVAAHVGRDLDDLPTHAELYRRVLAAGGGRMEEQSRPLFEAVKVSDLPPPHNPARCDHREKFGPLLEQTRHPERCGYDAALEAGALFLKSLTPDDLRACYYHQAQWKEIADESVRILHKIGPADPEKYKDEVRRSTLQGTDRRWLWSLFGDPIFIGSGNSYTNGQHRGCALWFSGADRAAVVTGDEELGTACVDWTYEGDG